MCDRWGDENIIIKVRVTSVEKSLLSYRMYLRWKKFATIGKSAILPFLSTYVYCVVLYTDYNQRESLSVIGKP